QAFGKAYAMAVLDYFAIKAAEKPTDKVAEKPIYKVQVGAFANKSNAEKLLKELKNKGYEGIIK
ncbi:MAG: SPOR domain-containing protein, partial [Oscillospiraceae bacterium]